MFANLKKICIFVILLTIAAASVSAQNDFNDLEFEVAKTLLKKDLRQAIKEAEQSRSNDLRSLFWRLSLYQRAAHDEKFALTVKQIIADDNEENRRVIYGKVLDALKDSLFREIGTLQLFLQKFSFDSDVYEKFVSLCQQKKEECDIYGFDKWLAQKISEESETKMDADYFYGHSPYWTWTARRLDWRGKFVLDTAEILNKFVEDVRKNPSDLGAALRYLRLFKKIEEISWLAETFNSEQSYDYYELGETLSNQAKYWQLAQNERNQIYQIAAGFLQKSLSLPFNERDKSLIWQYKLRFTSVPPVIKNPEKQLRFWTKTALAETFKNMGEAHNAQPIVEELMNLDTSDIMSAKPSRLSGMVQAQSGARVVESKILREQATRQNSYEYWYERVAYYEGRREKERVFDAYRQALAVVPFDLSNENSRRSRLYFIDRFADFAEDEFEYYGNVEDKTEWSDEEKQKRELWNEVEELLRGEFDKTKSNVSYSYQLTETIIENRFKKLSREILIRNSELFVNAAANDLIKDLDNSLYLFLAMDDVSREKKDSVIGQILKIAEKKDIEKAWVLCEALNKIEGQMNVAARIVPILVKNLKIAQNKFDSSKISDDNRYEWESVKNKYVGILFDTFLLANDWKSAEKLLLENFSVIYGSPLDQIIFAAAKNGAFGDAVRLWKLKANLNRRDIENLSSLTQFPVIVGSLREFYKQMKINEPYLIIPDIALRKLGGNSKTVE